MILHETVQQLDTNERGKVSQAAEIVVRSLADAPQRALRVMLITEGTYPFHFGGVSTWCHGLLQSLPEVRFSLLAMIDAPERPVRFALPPNVVDFRPVPLWGVRGRADLVPAADSAALRRRQRAVKVADVERDLLPLLTSFLDILMVEQADPEEFADVVHGLYRFFVGHDFDTAMRCEAVWRAFTQSVTRRFAMLAESHGYARAALSLADLTEGMNLVRSWLAPLDQPLPDIDVAHAAMAGMCTLVAVAAKRDQGAGFMLTEHGIFLRERLLAEASGSGSLFLKLLRLRFAIRTTELSYALADLIAPCCNNHQRWELRVGAAPDRLSTIYYGVDSSVFRPIPKQADSPPTVVWVGRIDPLKDVKTLLRAAAVVNRSRPDIVFRVYGAALPGSEDYHEECMTLRAELGLESAVVMEGYTSSPAAAFNQGDLVALSSISEGFPYSTLEAMLCAKAVVATSVGGIAEQIRGCGRVVEPRNPDQLGNAIIELMDDPDALARLGAQARHQAEQLFNRENERRAHLVAYSRMAGRAAERSTGTSTLDVDGDSLLPPAPPTDGQPRLMRTLGPEALAPVAVAWAWRRKGRAVRRSVDLPTVQQKLPTEGSRLIRPELGDEPIAELVGELRARIPVPVHPFEVTAVLESCGVNDEVARRHGAVDVFALGERVLGELRMDEPNLQLATHEPPPAPIPGGAIRSWLRYALTAVPGAAVPATVELLHQRGVVSSSAGVELMIGLVAGVSLSNVMLQGLAPRASLYTGCDNWLFARRVVRSFVWSAGFILAALLGGGLAMGQAVGWGTGTARLLVAIGFVAGTLLWLTAAGLVAAQSLPDVGAAVLAGALVTVVADPLMARVITDHTLGAVLSGYLFTITLLAFGSRRRLSGGTQSGAALAPPPLKRMMREAVPHTLYGFLVLVLLLAPHFALWLHPALRGNRARLTVLEVALNLPLLPLLTASALIERTARLYWICCRKAQISTRGDRPEQFAQEVAGFFRARRHLHYAYLVLSGVVLVGGVDAVMRLTWVRTVVLHSHRAEAQSAFVVSAIACLLLSVALFDGAAAILLGSLRAVIFSFAIAIAVSLLMCEIVIIWLVPSGASLVLLVGASVSVLLCRRALNRAMDLADHSYFISL